MWDEDEVAGAVILSIMVSLLVSLFFVMMNDGKKEEFISVCKEMCLGNEFKEKDNVCYCKGSNRWIVKGFGE